LGDLGPAGTLLKVGRPGERLAGALAARNLRLVTAESCTARLLAAAVAAAAATGQFVGP
jgi:nicotinamide mononucleotide (NMN) deamidase PncC